MKRILKIIVKVLLIVILLFVALIGKSVFATSLEKSTLVTGTQNLVDAIISWLTGIGITICGGYFIYYVYCLKTNDEGERQRNIQNIRTTLMATVLITVSLSLVEIPKHYYGSTVSIVDNQKSETTIAELKDKDCQGRETINIDGKWYVVTDTGWTLQAMMKDGFLTRKQYYLTGQPMLTTKYEIENVSVLRLFSECQGTFKGYFADFAYYRDADGFIFSATWNYEQYENAKNSSEHGGGDSSSGSR